jgi:Tfp pilus assembly protein PilN
MSGLRLDYQNNLPTPVLGWALLGVMMLVLIPAGIYLVHLSGRVHALESEYELASGRSSSHANDDLSRVIGKADIEQEIKDANDVLHHLSVPWNDLFKAVESSSGSHVTLLTLEPDFDRKQVKINGEANSYRTIMKYITELEGQDVFDSVYLQSHDVRQKDPDKPVRFSLIANWKEQP